MVSKLLTRLQTGMQETLFLTVLAIKASANDWSDSKTRSRRRQMMNRTTGLPAKRIREHRRGQKITPMPDQLLQNCLIPIEAGSFQLQLKELLFQDRVAVVAIAGEVQQVQHASISPLHLQIHHPYLLPVVSLSSTVSAILVYLKKTFRVHLPANLAVWTNVTGMT